MYEYWKGGEYYIFEYSLAWTSCDIERINTGARAEIKQTISEVNVEWKRQDTNKSTSSASNWKMYHPHIILCHGMYTYVFVCICMWWILHNPTGCIQPFSPVRNLLRYRRSFSSCLCSCSCSCSYSSYTRCEKTPHTLYIILYNIILADPSVRFYHFKTL